MQIYKTFIKLSVRNIGKCIMYLAILIILCSILSESESSFNETKLNVAVIDNDNTMLSHTLYDYIDENQIIKDIGDESNWSDYIFYHSVEYILVINKGFEDGILSGNTDNLLTSYQAPDSNSSYIVESQVNSFVNNVNTYLSAGYDLENACSKANESSSISAEVSLADKDNKSSFSAMNYFFNYASYATITIFITCIGLMLITFNQPELKARTNISCISFTKRNISILCAMLTYTVAIFAIYMLTAYILYKDDFLCIKGAYYSLNVISFMLVCLAITFLISQFCKTSSSLTMWSNILGLSSSFLCGVFVPRSLLPEKVINFSKCLPTYWYINAAEDIKLTNGPLTSVAKNSIFIQILFAIAILSVGLAVVKIRQQKTE